MLYLILSRHGWIDFRDWGGLIVKMLYDVVCSVVSFLLFSYHATTQLVLDIRGLARVTSPDVHDGK